MGLLSVYPADQGERCCTRSRQSVIHFFCKGCTKHVVLYVLAVESRGQCDIYGKSRHEGGVQTANMLVSESSWASRMGSMTSVQ